MPLAGALDDDVVVVEGPDPTQVVVAPLAPRTDHDDLTYAGVPSAPAESGPPEPVVVLPPAAPSSEVAPDAQAAPGAPIEAAVAGRRSRSEASAVPPEPATAGDTGDGRKRGSRRREREAHPGRRAKVAWTTLGVLVVLAAIAAGVLALLASRTPTHRVPPVVGGQEAAVVAQLRDLGFVPQVSRERKDGSAAGQVLATRPAPGESLAEGRSITVVVSDGPTLVTLPTDLQGKPQADAEAALRALGLFLQPAQAVWSEDVPAGAVIGYADGTPTELARGLTVALVVSQGPQPRQIPAVDGLDVEEAVAALERLGLVAQKVEVFSDTVDKGGLVGLDPAPGATAPRGATVTVQVSKGPELVEVPSLSGARSIDDAVRLLEAAGLQAGHAQGRLSGRPRAFDPGSGTKVPKGSSVDIILR
jgi:serine/threonine-protein kinase